MTRADDVQILWHPESPGMRVYVIRNWWQKLFYPEEFATLGESIKYSDAIKLVRAM